MADAGALAPYLDGIPVVADAATRDAKFPLPTRSQDQRCFNKGTGNVERWTGSAWVTDLTGSGGIVTRYSLLRLFPAVDQTGTTDVTAQITAAFALIPAGADLYVPVGRYKITSISVPQDKGLVGDGFTYQTDQLTTFGAANYAVTANVIGTVFVSTATSGVGITAAPTTNGGLRLGGFALLGPGSGTSVGLAIGSSTVALVGQAFPSILVGNFATGWRLRNVEDCPFTTPKARGCTRGFSLEANTNNCSFIVLDAQFCTDGMYQDTTTLSNSFLSPVFQANTGTGSRVNGTGHTFMSPYCESVGGIRAFDFESGTYNAIVSPIQSGVADGIRIQAGCIGVSLLAHAGTSAAPITNAGTGTFIQGNAASLTDTGVRTTILDGNSDVVKLPTQLGTKIVSSQSIAPGHSAGTPAAASNPRGIWYDDSLGRLWVSDGVSWRDTIGSMLLRGVSADRGDANVSLNVPGDVQVQRFATALTANRTITLNTGNATNGDLWRIVRTGLGAFTLDVGGLKTIPSGTAAFVDVTYDGTAWRLTGYGTL